MCFYNKKINAQMCNVATDLLETGQLDFSPIHGPTFEYGFSPLLDGTNEVLEFNDNVELNFVPEIFNIAYNMIRIPIYDSDDSDSATSPVPQFPNSYIYWGSFWPGGNKIKPFLYDGVAVGGKDSNISFDSDSPSGASPPPGSSPYFGYSRENNTLEKKLSSLKVDNSAERVHNSYGSKIQDIDSGILSNTLLDVLQPLYVEQLSKPTQFILMPGDELILGIERCPGDYIGTYGLTSHQSLSGSLLKIKAEPASMTLYGSLIKENKEYHNTINQDLTSNSVHEAFYGDPVLDEFEIEPISMYAGTTRDEYVTGDMFTGKNETLVIPVTIEEDASSTVRRPITSVTAGDVSDTWSLTRFNTYADESERYYDTLLPDIYEYSKAFKSYNPLYTVSDIGIDSAGFITGSVPTDPSDGTTWTEINTAYNGAWYLNMLNFPFENKISRHSIAHKISPSSDLGSLAVLYMEGLTDASPGWNQNDQFGQTGGCLGFKHGVRNITPITTTASFSGNSYGQFRDMLEQRHFGRFYKTRSFSPVFAGTPGFSGIRTIDDTLTIREQMTTRITLGPLIIKFVEPNSSTRTEPNLTDSSNLNAHATSSLPFFDDIDTYNSGSGRNRPHIPSNYLVKNTTVIASSAVLDFGFDPSDLS